MGVWDYGEWHSSYSWCSRYQNNTHGVGVARARTPTSDNNHHITRLVELPGFTWKRKIMLSINNSLDL